MLLTSGYQCCIHPPMYLAFLKALVLAIGAHSRCLLQGTLNGCQFATRCKQLSMRNLANIADEEFDCAHVPLKITSLLQHNQGDNLTNVK